MRHLRHRRHYATKYTARVTSKSPSGQTLSAEVTPLIQQDAFGYQLPRRHVICELSNLILKSKSPGPLLSSVSPGVTTLELSETLKCLNCPSLSLRLFLSFPSLSPGYRHDSLSYSRILLILSRSNLPDLLHHVRSLVSDMDRDNVRGTISVVNILIGVVEKEELGMCVGLVEKWGLRMNGYTYKCLVQAYLRSRDTCGAFRVYLDMKRKGYCLDAFAFNMLLHALAIDLKIDEAYKVFEDMKKRRCDPDEYTYTIMIRMNGKIGKPNESLAFFEEMLDKGYSPNLVAYNTMLEALAKGRMTDKAIHLFRKMMEKGCRPNEFTYSVILKLLASEGQLHKLDEVIEASKKYMNRLIYAYLVRTLNKLGHASEAHRIFCNMWMFHDKGDKDAVMSMLENLCNSSKTVEAIDLLSKVHEKGITPDTIMYNMVFSALGKLKQTFHLQYLYAKIKEGGPSPDIFTYNILISSFGRAGKVVEACKVFDELENSDLKPDIISYNALINSLGKNGDLDEAHMRFMEMRERGLNPDVVTYSTLIECFGKTDKVEMACRLFDDMISEGCYPNIVTYNILLDCLERCGRTAEAVDMYAKLKKQGLTPDSITRAVLERLQSGPDRKFRVRRKNPITGWVVSPLR